jgi:hypothetical protein
MGHRDFSSARYLLLAGALVLAAALLAACSPTFNWRDVPMTSTELTALLPCKPDRAERSMPLGGESVTIQMAGCEAGGATFAIASARADNAVQAEAWIGAWRASTRAQWQAATGGQVHETPVTVVRAAAKPEPWQIEARGTDADGNPNEARVRWFAHAQHDGSVAVYQATVLGKPSAPDAAGTFFEGLRLP